MDSYQKYLTREELKSLMTQWYAGHETVCVNVELRDDGRADRLALDAELQDRLMKGFSGVEKQDLFNNLDYYLNYGV